MPAPLPSSTDVYYETEEDVLQKIARKAKEQPLVPIGVIMTCGALHMSARALRIGDSRLANRMFYWRVGLQGFTIAALVVGGYLYGSKPSRPTDRDALLRAHAKEREAMWLEELERLDQEDKDRKARAKAFREANPRPDSSTSSGTGGGVAAAVAQHDKEKSLRDMFEEAKEKKKADQDNGNDGSE